MEKWDPNPDRYYNFLRIHIRNIHQSIHLTYPLSIPKNTLI